MMVKKSMNHKKSRKKAEKKLDPVTKEMQNQAIALASCWMPIGCYPAGFWYLY